MFCRTTSSKHHSAFPKFIQVACSLAECKVARAPCWLEGSINQEPLDQFLNRCISKSLPLAFRLPKRCWTRQIWSQNTATVEVRQLPNIWKPFDHPNWFQSSFQGTKHPAPPVAGPAATLQRTRTPSHPTLAAPRGESMELKGQCGDETLGGYPLVMTNIAMENHHF